MSEPIDRETVIRVVDYLTSFSGISLIWLDYDQVEDDEQCGEAVLHIDGEQALEIIADPVRFQRKLEMECAKRRAEERFQLSLEPPEMKRLRAFNAGRHRCQGKTPKGRQCSYPVVRDSWDDPATLDPERPEHRFCRKHLAEGLGGVL